MRQQLSRAAAPAAAGAGQPSGEAADNDGSAEAVPALSSAEAEAACQAALLQAEALVAAGQHAEALAATAPSLPLLGALPPGGASLAVQLWALRGHCQAQLGGLKQAVAEYGAAIQLAHAAAAAGCDPAAQPATSSAVAIAPTPRGLLAQLLLARAALLEQQEQVQAALEDAQEAAKQRLQQASMQAVAAQAVERLRRACRQAARM